MFGLFKSPRKVASKYILKGDELFRIHNFKAAVSHYKFALYFSSSVEAHLGIAKVLREQEKYPEAIEECNNAIRLDEQNGDALNFMAECFYTLGMYENSFYSFSKAAECEKNAKRQYSYYMMGKILAEADVWCWALKSYHTALDLEPEYEPAKKGIEEIRFYFN